MSARDYSANKSKDPASEKKRWRRKSGEEGKEVVGGGRGEHLWLTRADRAGWIDNRESEMIRGGWHEIETRPRR